MKYKSNNNKKGLIGHFVLERQDQYLDYLFHFILISECFIAITFCIYSLFIYLFVCLGYAGERNSWPQP